MPFTSKDPRWFTISVSERSAHSADCFPAFTVSKLRPFVGFDLRNEEATNIRIKTQLDCKEYIGNYQALQETDVPWRMMCLWWGLVADLLISLQLKHWWSVGSPFFESPSTRGVTRVTRVTTFEHIWTHIRNSSSIYINKFKCSSQVQFNSKDGKGVFNWRMVYPRIKMPTWSCTLTVGLYHSECLGPDVTAFG